MGQEEGCHDTTADVFSGVQESPDVSVSQN